MKDAAFKTLKPRNGKQQRQRESKHVARKSKGVDHVDVMNAKRENQEGRKGSVITIAGLPRQHP
ncbi:hypothetical protein [Ruegeria sp. HKCCD6228]|uniref:hypothetical protein n=1 Tax=Ruegeria sp. HKCCD6228 TaxID=2683001 RepID=UPI0035302D52